MAAASNVMLTYHYRTLLVGTPTRLSAATGEFNVLWRWFVRGIPDLEEEFDGT